MAGGLVDVPRRRKRLAFSRGPVSFLRKEERRFLCCLEADSEETLDSPVEVETDERRRLERGRKSPENNGGKGSEESHAAS